MGHKRLDTQSKKNVEESIAFYEGLIAKIYAIKAGTKSSIPAIMDSIRELEFDACYQKDGLLRIGDQANFTRAHGFLKMQEAYQTVIKLVEQPDLMLNEYQDEIEKCRTWLNRFGNERDLNKKEG